MTYKEWLCDNALSRFFVEACALPSPRFEGWLTNFLYDWQTLIAGIGAFIGAWLLWRQVQDQRDQARQEFERSKMRARIQLPHALGRLNLYWKACFQAWKAKRPDNRPPEPVAELQTIVDAAVWADTETFESLKALVTAAQAFEARLSDKNDRPSNFYNMMLVDIARLLYLTNRLFEFGRLREEAVIYTAPWREDLERELHLDIGVWKLSIRPNDRTHNRIQEALKSVPSRLNKGANENNSEVN